MVAAKAGFALVEAALAATYCVPEDAAGAFRAKLTAVQKLGILGNRPGKGQAIAYSADLVCRLVFAIEAFEFGLSPSVVVDIVERTWVSKLSKIFRDADKAASDAPGPRDIVLYITGVKILTRGWAKTTPTIGQCELGELSQRIGQWMGGDQPGHAPRLMAVNLSEQMRRFRAAVMGVTSNLFTYHPADPFVSVAGMILLPGGKAIADMPNKKGKKRR
jgi:hypothetical protein